jgi:predicted ATP-grasp superfamily ATP-dependent carboligase
MMRMNSTPWVFVHEYITGGGWASENLSTNLVKEGGAMLHAILEDFRRWGRVKTVTTQDRRLSHFVFPADEVVLIPPEGYNAEFLRILNRCQAALIIAPETNRVLSQLSLMVEDAGVRLLGSKPSAIDLCSDKSAIYDLAFRSRLPVPHTIRATGLEAHAAAEEIGYPVVIKPLVGVGCVGVSLAHDSQQLSSALELIAQEITNEVILVQQYIKGIHASVSLLANHRGCLPLSLNLQNIQPGQPFRYLGGKIPLIHPLKDRAFSVVAQLVSKIEELQGYLGVDLVLTEAETYFIEVNPRLTTSYLGLRQILRENLAELIWETGVTGELSKQVHLFGQACFDVREFQGIQ